MTEEKIALEKEENPLLSLVSRLEEVKEWEQKIKAAFNNKSKIRKLRTEFKKEFGVYFNKKLVSTLEKMNKNESLSVAAEEESSIEGSLEVVVKAVEKLQEDLSEQQEVEASASRNIDDPEFDNESSKINGEKKEVVADTMEKTSNLLSTVNEGGGVLNKFKNIFKTYENRFFSLINKKPVKSELVSDEDINKDIKDISNEEKTDEVNKFSDLTFAADLVEKKPKVEKVEVVEKNKTSTVKNKLGKKGDSLATSMGNTIEKLEKQNKKNTIMLIKKIL